MLKINKQIFYVNLSHYQDRYIRNLNKSFCISQEIADFLFNWSIETIRQFGKSILKTIPSKMYISNANEIENLKQHETVCKVLKIFDVLDLKKVDKLELICLFPFIVESDFENAFFCNFIII